jgi:DNA-binding NarL/FixJ family response regulator
VSTQRGEFTEREMQILPLVADGMGNAEIGKRLFMGAATVRDYMTTIMRKAGARNRTHLVTIAFRKGWVQ